MLEYSIGYVLNNDDTYWVFNGFSDPYTYSVLIIWDYTPWFREKGQLLW